MSWKALFSSRVSAPGERVAGWRPTTLCGGLPHAQRPVAPPARPPKALAAPKTGRVSAVFTFFTAPQGAPGGSLLRARVAETPHTPTLLSREAQCCWHYSRPRAAFDAWRTTTGGPPSPQSPTPSSPRPRAASRCASVGRAPPAASRSRSAARSRAAAASRAQAARAVARRSASAAAPCATAAAARAAAARSASSRSTRRRKRSARRAVLCAACAWLQTDKARRWAAGKGGGADGQTFLENCRLVCCPVFGPPQEMQGSP